MSLFAQSAIFTPLELIVPAGLAVLGFRAALQRAGLADHANRSAAVLAAVFGLWFALAVILAKTGLFAAPDTHLPVLPGFLAVVVIAGVLLFRSSIVLQTAADAVPLHWLVALQAFRVLGLVFIAQLSVGGLSAAFALPAGWGDAGVGLLALPVALVIWRQWTGYQAVGLIWNMLGVADLAIALTMGALTAPGPLGVLAGSTPSVAIAEFPLALIPAFGVPLFLFLHFISFRILARKLTEHKPRQPAIV